MTLASSIFLKWASLPAKKADFRCILLVAGATKVFDGHFKKNHRFKSAEIFLLPFFCGLTAILSKRPFLFTVSTLTAWRQDNGESIMFGI